MHSRSVSCSEKGCLFANKIRPRCEVDTHLIASRSQAVWFLRCFFADHDGTQTLVLKLSLFLFQVFIIENKGVMEILEILV